MSFREYRSFDIYFANVNKYCFFLLIMDYKKWSVGVIITNPKKTLFYLQQKDETYFIKEYRLRYCFFGGSVEKGEKEIEALKREIKEELDVRHSESIIKNLKRLFDSYFTNIKNYTYRFTLYESVIEKSDLIALSKLFPNEGKKGTLLTREELKNIPIFTDLEEVRDMYLESLG